VTGSPSWTASSPASARSSTSRSHRDADLDGAWTSIIAAELIAATNGLAYLIMQAGDYLNTALVFSGIIAIAILGLTLDACLRGLLLLADPSRRR
jgi:ABC-type nitrate/sulfonate/bicarbonate transport system permease component